MSYRQKLDVVHGDENYNRRISESEEKDETTLGLDGKFKWPIRIFTPILFIGTLLTNYLVGIDRNGQVSDKFSLWVTPPGWFFTIWAVIYTGLIIANIYNLIKNVWNLKTHIFFGITNILNIVWTVVFCIGSKTSVVIACFILIALTVFIYLTWAEMGNVPEQNFTVITYIMRNIFAFYLGWCIAASNINFGIVLVYWWNATKQQQAIVFWVITPLCAVGTFVYICWRYGKRGALSSFCVWLSVGWAFAGAAISTNKCLNGEC